MKVVHISTGYNHGGAAIACKRLVEAQRIVGIDARIITQESGVFPEYVYSTTKSFIKKKINFLRLAWEKFVFLFYEISKEGRFHYSLANTGEKIANHPLIKQSDIIHLHWINAGFISLIGLKELINTGKPIVWTMHDIWAFTGGCHIADKCVNYQDRCADCFYLTQRQKDIFSLKQQKRKSILYNTDNLFFIAPSKWQYQRAKSSSLLKGKNIEIIHNAIAPIKNISSKSECRKHFKLLMDKKLILFGAFNTNDRHKGMKYLMEALKILDKYPDIELMVFGKQSEEFKELPFKVNYLGYFSDEMKMRMVYKAADIFVTPSIEDNLPNTILESFTCGTPVVAFKTGGIPEIIDHKKNGYLAEFKNINDLAQGIKWCLENNFEGELSGNAIHKITTHFSYPIIGNEFEKLYRKLDKDIFKSQ